MAGNLGHRGLQVDFVDEGPWALSEVLDPDVAEPVHESLTQRGVTLRLGTRVEGFTGDGDRVRAVQTSAGELECDAVIVCLHKLPAAELAEAAGIELGTTGGIAVDEHMRTSKPGVWAAGDVVEVPHGLSMLPIRGLTGSHAYAQGRTAAFDVAGRELKLRPGLDPVGDGRRRLHDRRLLDRRDARHGHGRPLRARQGRRGLAGALLTRAPPGRT